MRLVLNIFVEGHIAGIIAQDKTAIEILQGKYADSHIFHSLFYYKEEIEKHYNITIDEVTPELVERFVGDPVYKKKFRNPGKAVTFSQL